MLQTIVVTDLAGTLEAERQVLTQMGGGLAKPWSLPVGREVFPPGLPNATMR
jgi:hypothetical protein